MADAWDTMAAGGNPRKLQLGIGSKVDVVVGLTLKLVKAGHRVLLFFMYLEVMNMVERLLSAKLGEGVYRVDGKVKRKEREEMVRSF